MAGNTFDFELSADDRASGQITVLEEKIRSLNPALDEARDKLKLGGDDSLTGLRGIGDCLRDVADGAKDGVRNIGDMIPPLKNFGALAGKLTGIGGIGAIIAGGSKLITRMADDGLNRTTSAANTGMSVEESTRLNGTLVQRGMSEDDARGQTEGYYEKLSQAVIGKDDQLLASFASIGAEIFRREDGSVDVTKTLLGLEEVIKTLPEHRNWELRDNLKLPPELIALLREGKLQERLNKSDSNGQTIDGEYAKKMAEVSIQLSEAGAKWSGLVNQMERGFYNFLSADSMVPDTGDLDGAMQRIKEHKERENDTEDNFYHGDKRKDIIAQALKDDEYKNSLGGYEKMRLIAHDPTDEMYSNIYSRYGDQWEKQKQQAEAGKKRPALNSKEPDNWVQDNGYNPNVRAFRNKNPGNVREASNEIGRDEPGVDANGNKRGFAIFRDEADGRAALARQLLLYMDRGNNTIGGIMQKYAPKKDRNDTGGYIKHMSGHMGADANTPLNLYDPQILSRFMSGIIKKESGYQPYSYEEMMGSIDEAVNSPRWSGLRHQDKLSAQREQWSQKDTASDIPTINHTLQQDTQQIVDALSKAIRESLTAGQEGIPIEITFINPDTGARQTVNTKPKGRVTTAMNMP
ncbi:hypothetical protein AYY18_00735 [Morganella psychrotolerans]|uniref:Uncharacterized protein n=2 Tax=Morganella psychrotolerans TaxID=368603 RepID=A0A1B8HUB4_9GAMM|nr:hypothetical protein AYY18_00735 [Morganella psychrotolerans]